MGFNPGTGMTPNDWVETEARRVERGQRADRPHGREIGATARRVTALVIGLAALALVVYALLGLTGVVDVPGFSG